MMYEVGLLGEGEGMKKNNEKKTVQYPRSPPVWTEVAAGPAPAIRVLPDGLGDGVDVPVEVFPHNTLGAVGRTKVRRQASLTWLIITLSAQGMKVFLRSGRANRGFVGGRGYVSTPRCHRGSLPSSAPLCSRATKGSRCGALGGHVVLCAERGTCVAVNFFWTQLLAKSNRTIRFRSDDSHESRIESNRIE